MNKELRKMQRAFNAAMEDGDDLDEVERRGYELIVALSEQPRLSKNDADYLKILVATVAVTTGLQAHPELWEGKSQEEQFELLLALGDLAMKRLLGP